MKPQSKPQSKKAHPKGSPITSTPAAEKLPIAQKEEEAPANPLAGLMELLGPALAFHQEAKANGGDDDIRIFWDFQVVRGKQTPLVVNRGSTVLAACMGEAMFPKLPSLVYDEVVTKIARPLLTQLQDLTNRKALKLIGDIPPTSVAAAKPVVDPLRVAGLHNFYSEPVIPVAPTPPAEVVMVTSDEDDEDDENDAGSGAETVIS